jgi:hypothetical protein
VDPGKREECLDPFDGVFLILDYSFWASWNCFVGEGFFPRAELGKSHWVHVYAREENLSVPGAYIEPFSQGSEILSCPEAVK